MRFWNHAYFGVWLAAFLAFVSHFAIGVPVEDIMLHVFHLVLGGTMVNTLLWVLNE